jgi:hypothetical protein
MPNWVWVLIAAVMTVGACVVLVLIAGASLRGEDDRQLGPSERGLR